MDFRGIRQTWKTKHKAISFYYSIKITDMYNILKNTFIYAKGVETVTECGEGLGCFGSCREVRKQFWEVNNGLKLFDTVSFSGLLYKVKLSIESLENTFKIY